MKVAIVGSRDYPDPVNAVEHWIVPNLSPQRDAIISGGARGVDYAAYRAAVDYGYEYIEFPADWESFGKSAGYRRNHDIVQAADKVVAFWDGHSRGTKHTIDLALSLHVDLEVVFPSH